MLVMIWSASDATVLEAAHRDHLSHSSHSTLFHLAHVRMTVSDSSVHLDVLSRQHLRAHFCIVSALKFTVGMVPASRDSCLDVV